MASPQVTVEPYLVWAPFETWHPGLTYEQDGVLHDLKFTDFYQHVSLQCAHRVPDLDALAAHVAWVDGGVHLTVADPGVPVLVVPDRALREEVVAEALRRALDQHPSVQPRRHIRLPRSAHREPPSW